MLFSRFVHSSFLALPYTHTHTHTHFFLNFTLQKLIPTNRFELLGLIPRLKKKTNYRLQCSQRQRQQTAVSNKKYPTARTQNQPARTAQSLSIRRLQPAEERERETEWKEMDRAGRGRTKRCFMTIYETSIFFPFVHCLSASAERHRERIRPVAY